MEIEKGLGWDWAVHYEREDGTTDVVSVFGQLIIEDAIREARFSLEGTDMGYAILAARRLDH
jgi:hypothetical protein